PVAPQSSLRPLKLFVTIAVPLHTSPPLKVVFNQASRAAVLPAPSHSTVLSDGATVQLGLVVSSILNVAVVVDDFPQSSVAVKVTVALPLAPHPSDSAVKLSLQLTPLHASCACAPP